MSSTTKAKRISRIERRGTQELVQAMHAGQISVRTADSLFYLAAEEQRVQLQRRLAAAEQWQLRSQVAAETIRGYLQNTKRVDLQELQCRIRDALATCSVILACFQTLIFIS